MRDLAQMIGSEALRRVHDFHQFLAGWLGATLPAGDAAIEAQVRTFDSAFTCIAPDGSRQSRDALRDWLRRNWGMQAGLTIEIVGAQVLACTNDTALVTYEEQQSGPATASNRRVASAWFVRSSSDTAVRWAHVHETWLG